jgi:hypothetical protein
MAFPPPNVTVLRTADPSLKVTVPVGVPAAAVTVAVNVTDCPEIDGLVLEVKEVLVS